jgi:protoporphyrinogen IX oxidase
MEYYNYIKSLHLIFVITWFAGLFYIVRLFVYQIEANQKPSPDKDILLAQYKIMTYRLWYIITWPSAILATFFAFWLILLNTFWLEMSWMHVKLFFVVLLFIYHLKCHKIYISHKKDKFTYSSNFMRLWNEGATIILFAVVFLVILKNAMNWIYGVVGIVLFSVIIMLGFQFYKKIRNKNNV